MDGIDEQDQGVTPLGPGSQASPEAAGASSPSVSIPNAATRLREIADDLDQRMKDVRRAKTANQALGWLQQYGETAASDKTIRYEIHLSFASKCGGADEANDYIERALIELSGEIVALATALARTDVERVFPASGIEGEAGDPQGLHPEGESPAPERGDAQPLDPKGQQP